MPTINGKPFSTTQNLNLKKGILRFGATQSSNPVGSADYGLYVNASGQLIFSAAGSATTLGATGGSGSIPSLDAIFQGDQTLNLGGLSTLTIDRSSGNNDVLTLTNSGGGSGALIQITNVGTGKDIEGTNDTWSFSKAGDIVANMAVLAGDAGSDSITLTAGDVQISDGSINVVDADNAFSLKVTNDTATTASVAVIAGSGAFTGSTTTSFVTITPSGLTTGTAVYLPVAALTTGKAVHVVGNAVTSGILVHIASSAASTQLTGAGRLLKVDHTGNATGTGIVAEVNSAAADETVVLKVTASAALTGSILTVSGSGVVSGTAINAGDLDGLTTGIGLSLASTSTGMTSGSLLRISTATTGAVATNGIVSVRATGAYTSTSNVGLVDVVASATTAGTVVRIASSAASQTATELLRVVASGFTTGYTGNVAFFKSSSTTGAANVIAVESDNSTAGNAVSITANGLTTGTGLLVTSSGTITTTGELVSLVANSATTATGVLRLSATGLTDGYAAELTGGGANFTATGGMLHLAMGAATVGSGLKIVTSGVYTGTTGLINIDATSATTGVLVDIAGTGITTGTFIKLNATEATLTTGKYVEFYDGAANDFSVAKYGATVIAGNALGTAALTLTKGDVIVSDGNLNVAGKIIFSATETIVAGGTTTALDLSKAVHYIDADAGGDIFTLADGVAGQITTILLTSSTGVATITPANLAGGTSVTLNADGDSVVLQFMDTEWFILGGNSYAVV